MKDDSISRQAAIEVLNVGAELLRRVLDDADIVGAERAKYEWGLELIESYISDMKELPPVQPEQRWIPVTERPPEVGTYVLISKKALNFKSNLPSVCTAHKSCDPRSGKEEWNDMLFGKLDDDDVLAWMPQPEPYRKGGDK